MEHAITKNCSLQQVGDLLDSKGYGIALRLSKFETFVYGLKQILN